MTAAAHVSIQQDFLYRYLRVGSFSFFPFLDGDGHSTGYFLIPTRMTTTNLGASLFLFQSNYFDGRMNLDQISHTTPNMTK
jgi:hypothetical protein